MGVRICPLCEVETTEPICPTDGVPTLDPAIFSAAEHEIGPGSVVAERYKVTGVLGKGGMGAVFVATQLSMNRTVALKVLRRDLTQTPRHVKRFYQEAQAASQLNHPNIVRVFDFGIDTRSREPFIAMELIEGKTLRRLLDEGPLPENRAALILSQVAKALVEAHEKNIVHRDLKPDNVMISELPDGDEHVRVLDFGVAKMIRPEDSGNEKRESLTATGSTVGTPLYMSPEQISGERVDFRSDLYALGCMLYETLTGAPPFTAPEALAVLMKHVNEPPPPLANASEPTRVLYESLLSKARLLRPPNTTVVAKLLGAIARGESPDTGAMLAAGHTPRPDRVFDVNAETLPAQQVVQPAALTASSHFDAVPPQIEVRTSSRAPALMIAAAILFALAGAVVFFALREQKPEPAPVVIEAPVQEKGVVQVPNAPDASELVTQPPPPQKKRPVLKTTR